MLQNSFDNWYGQGLDQIAFADGTVWTQSDLRVRWLASASTTGNDSITAFNTNDTIRGGLGNDTLAGATGNDTYLYARGDGNDTITENVDGGTGDRLVLEGINPGDLTITRNGNHATLVIAESAPGAGNGGAIALQNTFELWSGQGIDQIAFADGTVWTQDDLRAKWLVSASTAGNDSITAFNTNDTIRGGLGNDTLAGATGNDTYLYARGDGNDTITENVDGGTADKLVLEGINPAEVTITRNGNDATLVLVESAPGAGDGAAIVLQKSFDNWSGQGLDQIAFADGTVWTQNDLRVRWLASASTAGNDSIAAFNTNDTISGGLGNDTIDALDGNDRIIGGTGDDLVYETAGNDTYVWNVGDGDDAIVSYGSWDGVNTLELGSGILPGDVIITYAGTTGQDINIRMTGQPGSITLQGQRGISSSYGLDQIVFANGTIWNRGAIQAAIANVGTQGADVIYATASPDEIHALGGDDLVSGLGGNDLIFGDAGNDRLVGGLGNDTLDGGTENDVAVFAGVQTGYTITTAGGSIQIVDIQTSIDGNDGTDTLINIEAAEFKDGVTVNLAAPIVLDLDGDGIELVDANHSSARFDFDGDGIRDDTGWIGKGDGILVYDRNGDGRVSDASEISFIDDLVGARSDLEGLAAFDSNGDGTFSAQDAEFGEFRVWKDKDGDGVVDRKELLTLRKAGIASIDLAATPTERSWNWGSNIVINQGGFARTNGRRGALADVALNYTSGRNPNPHDGTSSTDIDTRLALMLQDMASFGARSGEADRWGQRLEIAPRFDYFIQ